MNGFFDGIITYFVGFDVLAIICLIAGLVLMIIEMFTPGLGGPGLLGLLALIAAIVLRADTLKDAIITVALIIIILGVAAYFVFRSFKKGAISRSPIVLSDKISEVSTSLGEESAKELIGAVGTAITALRPSGIVEFEVGRRDVVSAGEFIGVGSSVVVTNVEGLRILVKRNEN